jgi:hypothetical protein
MLAVSGRQSATCAALPFGAVVRRHAVRGVRERRPRPHHAARVGGVLSRSASASMTTPPTRTDGAPVVPSALASRAVRGVALLRFRAVVVKLTGFALVFLGNTYFPLQASRVPETAT